MDYENLVQEKEVKTMGSHDNSKVNKTNEQGKSQQKRAMLVTKMQIPRAKVVQVSNEKKRKSSANDKK